VGPHKDDGIADAAVRTVEEIRPHVVAAAFLSILKTPNGGALISVV
jgi:hypothetical protein